VVPVRSGRVRFDGADISGETPYQRVRRGIGYVPQGREIFSRLTVAENLAMDWRTVPVRPGFRLSCSSCSRC
jgi:urea transport system ATP-binding protein